MLVQTAKISRSLLAVDQRLVAVFHFADEHLFEMLAVVVQFCISLTVLVQIIDIPA